MRRSPLKELRLMCVCFFFLPGYGRPGCTKKELPSSRQVVLDCETKTWLGRCFANVEARKGLPGKGPGKGSEKGARMARRPG